MSVESQAPESVAPEAATERGGVRLWFAALFRALFIIVLTLAVLAALGYAADVALHRVTRTSSSNAMYAHIYEVDVVVDGDGSVAVTGSPSTQREVALDETDRSTIFDHPQRAVSVIAGTLFVSIRCPDSLCTANLSLSTPPDTRVNIRVGNALRLGKATVEVSNLTGPVDLSAWPANVTIKNSSSLVTGMVAGSLTCGVPAVCIVQVPR
ncbi:MAG TPA: hypothetical protein VFU74_04765 [Actinocrinis sp.]|nr:hypothetical protein [Actinocrinis sp.]